MRSSVPRCLKIGRHKKIHRSPRAFSFFFTVILFTDPLVSLSSGFALSSRPKKARRPKFETRAEAILFHIARVHAPPRDVTYEKQSSPAQSSPARVKRLLSLCEMNSRDAYGSYDVRAYIRGIPKEFRRLRIPRGRVPLRAWNGNVLHKAVIPRGVRTANLIPPLGSEPRKCHEFRVCPTTCKPRSDID